MGGEWVHNKDKMRQSGTRTRRYCLFDRKTEGLRIITSSPTFLSWPNWISFSHQKHRISQLRFRVRHQKQTPYSNRPPHSQKHSNIGVLPTGDYSLPTCRGDGHGNSFVMGACYCGPYRPIVTDRSRFLSVFIAFSQKSMERFHIDCNEIN